MAEKLGHTQAVAAACRAGAQGGGAHIVGGLHRAPRVPRASEAAVAVLQRVVDPEESIHDLVAKVFHGMWFAGACSAGATSDSCPSFLLLFTCTYLPSSTNIPSA